MKTQKTIEKPGTQQAMMQYQKLNESYTVKLKQTLYLYYNALTMKSLVKLCLVIMLAASALQPAAAQDTKSEKKAKKEAEIKRLIDTKNYTFMARFMYPLGGGQQYLNTMYDLQVNKDTVVSFLPYFGVAFANAGYNTDDNGVKFTSTKFDYETTPNAKGGWRVTIRPKDTRSTNQMILTIASNGNADLSVISTNRQRIRYDGYITQKEKTK